MGLGRQEGPLSSGCESIQMIGLFLGNVIWSGPLLVACWRGEGDDCARVFDAVSIVYLEDANEIQIWFQCYRLLAYTPQQPSSK